MAKRYFIASLSIVFISGWSFGRRLEPAKPFNEPLTVIEQKGIAGVAFLGDNVFQVRRVWGSATRVVKQDWPYAPHYFHEYHKRGVLFEADRAGTILGIVLFAKSDRQSVYATFNGSTAKGLRFSDLLGVKELYAVYGKPAKRLPARDDSLRDGIGQEEPFILDAGQESAVVYPQLEWMCWVSRELVKKCHVGGLKSQEGQL